MTKARQVRYAVIGAGNISQVAVLPAFKHASGNSKLVAVVSGDADKRAALKKEYGFALDGDYADLEAILATGEVDAVYVATPNSLHRDFTVRAARAGVHVLCEKPMATSVDDCRVMSDACASARVKLMVAYRLHFEEASLLAIDIARRGTLGELVYFESAFSHVVRDGDIRRDPTLGGGAAFDLGVYCINAARNLFATEPLSVFARVIEREGTDETTMVTMTFPGGKLAQFVVSNAAAQVSSYRIAGSRGDLRVEAAFDYAGPLTHHLTLEDGTKSTTFGKRDQFAPELIYFSDCILHDKEPEPSAEEGLCDVRVVEAILESAREGAPVELLPYQRTRRPTLDQEIHAPAIGKPKTVHAPSPSVR